MAQIILEIPNDKVVYALEGFLKVNPNEELLPDSEEKKYTDVEWVKQVLMTKIIKDVKRGHQLIGYDTINVQADSEVVN